MMERSVYIHREKVMIENKYFDCFFGAIAQVLKEYNINYNYLNIGHWDFAYNKSNGKVIGNNIKPYVNRNVEVLKGCYGIKLEWYSKEKFEKISERISNDNILIKTDLYDCYWNKAYHKQHFGHNFRTKKQNINEYLCNDPYFNYCNFIIEKKNLQKIIKKFAIINTTNVKYSSEYAWKEIKEDAIYYYNNVSSLERLSDDLSHNYSVVYENPDCIKDIYAIPLLDNINIITRKKKSYSIMLKEVCSDMKIDLEKVFIKCEECTKCWTKIKNIILKNCLLKDDIKTKLKNAVDELYYKEVEFRNYYYEKIKMLQE